MAAPDLPALVAVLGPTASGKSALGLALAERLDGEILCCDSMQVYRGMDIGTGKPTADEQRRVPHHLLDLAAPDEPFHAAAWAEGARRVIAEVTARDRLPIVVGGTGLYFRALTQGLFDAPASDPAIRERHRLEAAAAGVDALHARLRTVDPEAAAAILPGDLLRISRALEIFEQTGVPITELRRRAAAPAPLRVYRVLVDPELDTLRPRIAARVDAMIAAGFVREVEGLMAAGYADARAVQGGLGYGQLVAHLRGALPLDAAIAETKQATVAYARRQRTWFRKQAPTLRVPLGELAAAAADQLAGAIDRWRTCAGEQSRGG